MFNPFFVKQKKLEGTWNSFSEQLEAFNSNRLGLIYYPFKTQNIPVRADFQSALNTDLHLQLYFIGTD